MVITVMGVIDGVKFYVENHPEVTLILDFPYLFRQKVIANVERLENGTYHVLKYFGLGEGEDLSLRYVADQVVGLDCDW